MGLRFRKSKKIGNFTRVNLSKSGVGMSFSVPGSGISYNTKSTNKKRGLGCCSIITAIIIIMSCLYIIIPTN
jgi:hypothetical protein